MRNAAYFLIILSLSCWLLVAGSTLFVPLAYAIFISFLLYPLSNWMESKGLGRGASVSISVLAFILVMILAIAGITAMLAAFASEWPVIYEKLMELSENIMASLTEYLGWT